MNLIQLVNQSVPTACFFLKIEVQLIYNVVLITAIQQSDSVIHIYTVFFKIFFSIMVYHRILNIVPCAIQQDLVVYPFYIYKLTSADSNLPLHSSPNPRPLDNHQSVVYVRDSVSISQIGSFVIFQIPHISDIIWYLSFSF